MNSLEQFCINFANETLQKKFTGDIINGVQIEYMEEGIEYEHIQYEDNSSTLELMAAKVGIFDLLDDACNGHKTDDEFVSRLVSMHKQHPRFVAARFAKDKEFTVCHFVRDVTYKAAHFLSKNVDFLHEDLKEALGTSTSDFVRSVVVPVLPPPSSGGGNRHVFQVLTTDLYCTSCTNYALHECGHVYMTDVVMYSKFDSKRCTL